MQILPLSSLNSSHANSFKGLLKVDHNTYVNTDHVITIVQSYSTKKGMPEKFATTINLIENNHEVCKAPIETVIKAYSEAAKTKDAVADATNYQNKNQ